MLMRSDGVVQGAPVVVESLETVEFHDDGSIHWKTYFDIPEGSEYGEWTAQTGDTAVSKNSVRDAEMGPRNGTPKWDAEWDEGPWFTCAPSGHAARMETSRGCGSTRSCARATVTARTSARGLLPPRRRERLPELRQGTGHLGIRCRRLDHAAQGVRCGERAADASGLRAGGRRVLPGRLHLRGHRVGASSFGAWPADRRRRASRRPRASRCPGRWRRSHGDLRDPAGARASGDDPRVAGDQEGRARAKWVMIARGPDLHRARPAPRLAPRRNSS